MKRFEKSIRLNEELNSLRPIKPEDERRIMDKFRLDWNYHSNHLEGNSLTYGETKALILHNITAQGKPLKDHLEITGHNEAIELILDVVKEKRPLTESFIRELHKLILKASYTVDAITPTGERTKKQVQIGVYKSSPNHVKTRTGEIFRFSTPEETPAEMEALLKWFNERKEEEDINPILLATEFHYRFVRIHPFDDGNGRMARILMNFILMQFGYPPLIIKTEDRQDYFSALEQADGGQIEPFLDFISDNLNHSLEIMIKGAKGEAIEEPDDVLKEIALLDQRLKALGKNTEIFKDQINLFAIYEESIKPLSNEFINECKRLEKYYKATNFYMWTDNMPQDLYEKVTVEAGKEFIRGDLKAIKLIFDFKAFKHDPLPEFKYDAMLEFKFTELKYFVRNQNALEYQKKYGEQLVEMEIKKLVEGEIKRHLDEIKGYLSKISIK